MVSFVAVAVVVVAVASVAGGGAAAAAVAIVRFSLASVLIQSSSIRAQMCN